MVALLEPRRHPPRHRPRREGGFTERLRKNWLFAGSDNGGRTAAVLFSLIATCQRHHVEPFAYLRDILTRIAGHPHHRLAELLPGNWKPTA